MQLESRTCFSFPSVLHHTHAHGPLTTRAQYPAMVGGCAHHCCQVAAQECAVRTAARRPLCVQPSHGGTHNLSASRRIGVRNSCAPTVAQLPEHPSPSASGFHPPYQCRSEQSQRQRPTVRLGCASRPRKLRSVARTSSCRRREGTQGLFGAMAVGFEGPIERFYGARRNTGGKVGI